jgi:hypothetical protein
MCVKSNQKKMAGFFFMCKWILGHLSLKKNYHPVNNCRDEGSSDITFV